MGPDDMHTSGDSAPNSTAAKLASLPSTQRRQFLQLTAALGVAGMTAGCLGDDDDDPADDTDDTDDSDDDTGVDSITASFWENLVDDYEDLREVEDTVLINETLSWAFDEFESEYGVEVEYQQLGIVDWIVEGDTIVQGDGATDVWPALAAQFVGPQVHGGHLLPIQDYIDDDILDNIDTTFWTFEDGHLLNLGQGDDIYGIPFYSSGFPLWYNIPVLEEAGIDHEDLQHRRDVSWEEFNDICRTIRDETDHYPMAWGTRGGDHFGYMYNAAIVKSMGFDVVLELLEEDSDVSLTDDEFVEAVGLIEEWRDEEFFNPDHLSLEIEESVARFMQNQAGFVSTGVWITENWSAMADPDELGPIGEGFDYMWYPYRPDVYEDGQNEIWGGPTGAWCIPTVAEDRGTVEAAADFINFFCSEEVSELRAANEDRIVTWEGVEEGSNPTFAAMSDDIGNPDVSSITRLDDVLVPEFKDELFAAGQDLLEGSIDAEELQQRVDSALQEGVERYV